MAAVFEAKKKIPAYNVFNARGTYAQFELLMHR
jgi:hypothetical protein